MPTTDTDEERRLRSVADMAADGETEEEDDDGTPQLVLPGTASPLNTKVGGKKPTESFFKMSGVSLPISGNTQVDKDEEMWVAIPVAIDKVEVANRRSKGEIVGVKRVHLASAIGLPVILDGPPAEVS